MPDISSSVRVIRDLPQSQRVNRYPKHTWQLRHLPYVIQPCMIAPVMAGETMTKAAYQVRARTLPINNPLIGWWLEYYMYYCPFSCLPNGEELQQLMIDGSDPASISEADDPMLYAQAGYPNFMNECLIAVTERYFRAPGEAWDAAGTTVAAPIGAGTRTMPIAQIRNDSWLDSVTPLTAVQAMATVGAQDEVAAPFQNLDEQRVLYEQLKSGGFVQMTYEDWLRTQGVSIPGPAKEPEPEELRFSRWWTYPSNTIDPATGLAKSACVWAETFSADEPRRFDEPGFLFACTIVRPKVYLSRQYGAAAQLFNDLLAWNPKQAHEAAASIRSITKQLGPLGSGVADGTSPADDYVVDLDDLLLYGDQFIGGDWTLTETDAGFVALPTTGSVNAINKSFPSLTDINALFSGATQATRRVEQDGAVQLAIKGWQTDQTVFQR